MCPGKRTSEPLKIRRWAEQNYPHIYLRGANRTGFGDGMQCFDVGLGDSRIDESRDELAFALNYCICGGLMRDFRPRVGKAKRAHPTTFLYGYNPP